MTQGTQRTAILEKKTQLQSVEWEIVAYCSSTSTLP